MTDTAAAPAGGDARPGTTTDDLETLQRQLAEARANEKQARAEAQRAAEGANKRVSQAEGDRMAAHEAAVTNALTAAESEATALEEKAKKAMEDGDATAHAKATRELTSVQYRIESLKGAKHNIEQQKARVKEAPPADDALAGFTPETRAWVEKHPDFLKPGAFRSKVLAAHYASEAEGITVDTPEYFDYLEEHAGLKEPHQDPVSEAAEPPPQRRTPASTAAPVVRTAPGDGRQPPRTKIPALTPEQKEAAEFSFPDEFKKNPADAYVLYADYLEKSKSEGKMLFQQRGN